MRYFAKTIQRKLLVILLVVGFLPAIAGVLYIYSGTLLALDDVLGSFLRDRAESAGTAVDEALEQLFQSAAKSRNALNDGEVLEFLLASDDFRFNWCVVTDELGNVIEDGGVNGHVQVPIPPGLQRVGSQGEIFLDEVILDTGGSELRFISQLEGAANHYFVCGLSSMQVLGPVMERSQGGRFLKVFSNRGQIINQDEPEPRTTAVMQQRYSEMRQNGKGWLSSTPDAEAGFLIGYCGSRNLRARQRDGLTSVDWIMLAQMDVSEVSDLVGFLLWRNFLFGILLAPALVLLSWWLTRRFLRPVRQLHAQANEISHGNLSARVALHTNDELEDLGDAFNQMADRLHKSHLALEEQMRHVETKARQIALVSNIGHAIVAAFTMPKVVETIHVQLRSLLTYDALTVVIFHGASGAAIHAIGEEIFDARDLRDVRFFCEEQLLTRSRRAGTLPPAGTFASDAILNHHFSQFCLMPLDVEKGLMGALILARTENEPFNELERRPLVQVSQILALAIEHIELYERTRNFAQELEAKVGERAQQLERAHEKLLQSERFAATGRLAANIAHEVNNPLGIIKNYLRIMRERGPGQTDVTVDALRVIEEELDRIARIVKGLLDFYRPSTAAPTEVNVNEEIAGLLTLLGAGFRRKRIKVDLNLAPDMPSIMLSQDHIRQVVLNLMRNAEDAVDVEGEIKITTGLKSESDRHLLTLEVADNGCGISPEDRAHIFEPFFTKKREGQGTGLGLSVTYSIVRNLGGTIEVRSEPDKGTTFMITLPCEQNIDRPYSEGLIFSDSHD